MKNKTTPQKGLIRHLFSSEGLLFTDTTLSNYLKIEAPLLSFWLGICALAFSWYEPLFKLIMPGSAVDVAPLLLLLAAVFVGAKRALKVYPLHFWYLAFLLLAGISSVWAVIRGDAGLNALLYLAVLVQVFLSLLWGQMQNGPKVIKSALFLGVPVAGYGIWQYFTGNVVFTTSSLESIAGRSSAFFTSPNVFGMLMIVLLLVAMSQVNKTNYQKYLIFIVIFLIAAITTLSRTAWLAGLLGVVPLLKLTWPKFKNLGLGFVAGIKSRFDVLGNPEYWLNASIDGRVWAVRNGLHILKKFPFLGTGAGTYGGRFAEIYSSPIYFYGMQDGYVPLLTTDNQYIAFLVQFGLLGFGAFAGFGLALWRQSYLTGGYAKLSRALLLAFGFMMLTANSYEFLAVSILVMAIVGVSLSESQ